MKGGNLRNRAKTLGARQARTNNTLNPLNQGPYWWQANALITASSQLSKYRSNAPHWLNNSLVLSCTGRLLVKKKDLSFILFFIHIIVTITKSSSKLMRNYARWQKEELSALISVNVCLAFSSWIHIFHTPIHKNYADIALISALELLMCYFSTMVICTGYCQN